MKIKLTFDDVGIAPVHNNVSSRLTPNLETRLTRVRKMSLPILAANMDTVIGTELAGVLVDKGIVPIFHRFTSFEVKTKWINEFPDCFISCGLSRHDLSELTQLRDEGLEGVCFDVAQGHDVRVYAAIEYARDLGLEVIAGNVCTAQGYVDLVNAGADAVKVGIGPGAACTTRTVTGFGVPQMSALLDIRQESLKYKVPYIADGGIRNSGDAVKALAAGASSVMLGKAFAATNESAGEKRAPRDGSSLSYTQEVKFRGQSSKDFQEDYFGRVKDSTVAEGIDMWIPVTGSATDLIEWYEGGIRSGLTYAGSTSIKEFQKKVLIHDMLFQTTTGYRLESNPRK